jgi:hypothetical protein
MRAVRPVAEFPSRILGGRELARRSSVALLGCVWFLVGHLGQAAPAVTRPIVGAIRWDAWFGEDPTTTVGFQVERTLSPQQWHYRLPFFGREISPSSVEVRANVQSVMDAEIRYAHASGIDYWAFVMYPKTFPSTTGGLDLYLRSAHKKDIRFCMMPDHLDDETTDRLVDYFKDPSYQTVLDGRPLLYLLGPNGSQGLQEPRWRDGKGSIGRLRQRALRALGKNPYIVHLWGWSGAKEIANELSVDAIGAYSLNFEDKGAPYATLAAKTREKWDEWRKTGLKVVPLVTSGWDRRPRVMNPVSWENSPPRPDEIEYYYAAPTPAELGSLLGDALSWCERNTAAAKVILIYAWNEIDEGGWLVPSLWPDQGSRRLDAIRAVLARK